MVLVDLPGLPSTSHDQVLLGHNRNATAIRANPHWAGEMLMPYANRIGRSVMTKISFTTLTGLCPFFTSSPLSERDLCFQPYSLLPADE